jgi:hypothetical protein
MSIFEAGKIHHHPSFQKDFAHVYNDKHRGKHNLSPASPPRTRSCF